ncbi:MAG: hypothetical protein IKS17_10425 [Firmicutes bacterium]|nr:hypothetical protein [Bacillota bacterium]
MKDKNEPNLADWFKFICSIITLVYLLYAIYTVNSTPSTNKNTASTTYTDKKIEATTADQQKNLSDNNEEKKVVVSHKPIGISKTDFTNILNELLNDRELNYDKPWTYAGSENGESVYYSIVGGDGFLGVVNIDESNELCGITIGAFSKTFNEYDYRLFEELVLVALNAANLSVSDYEDWKMIHELLLETEQNGKYKAEKTVNGILYTYEITSEGMVFVIQNADNTYRIGNTQQ